MQIGGGKTTDGVRMLSAEVGVGTVEVGKGSTWIRRFKSMSVWMGPSGQNPSSDASPSLGAGMIIGIWVRGFYE